MTGVERGGGPHDDGGGGGTASSKSRRAFAVAVVFTVLVLVAVGLVLYSRWGHRRPGPGQALTGPVFNVASFGAVGNGSTDDTAAIQAAIDAAADAGGGSVVLDGLYRISVQPGTEPVRALTIHPNLRLTGGGTVRLGPHQGGYESVLAGDTPGADLSGFSMDHLTVDQNGTENRISSAADIPVNSGTGDRSVLAVHVGSAVVVRDVTFHDIGDTLTTVSLNGDNGHGGSDVINTVIEGNRFEGVGDSTIEHDHSSVYWAGTGLRLVGNTFDARARATIGAVSALETHGASQDISDNQIRNYTNGMNVTGVSSVASEAVTVRGNHIEGAAFGIYLWSFRFGTRQSGFGLDATTVEDNTISLDRAQWAVVRFSGLGSGYVAGVILNAGNDLASRQVRITDNHIRFTPSSLPMAADDAGVRWVRTTAVVDEDIAIVGNRTEAIAGDRAVVFRAPALRTVIDGNRAG